MDKTTVQKPTELDKLKYWLDTEFSVLHIMLAVIMVNLTEGWFYHVILYAYIVTQVAYMIPRLALLATVDKDYLRVFKREQK